MSCMTVLGTAFTPRCVTASTKACAAWASTGRGASAPARPSVPRPHGRAHVRGRTQEDPGGRGLANPPPTSWAARGGPGDPGLTRRPARALERLERAARSTPYWYAIIARTKQPRGPWRRREARRRCVARVGDAIRRRAGPGRSAWRRVRATAGRQERAGRAAGRSPRRPARCCCCCCCCCACCACCGRARRRIATAGIHLRACWLATTRRRTAAPSPPWRSPRPSLVLRMLLQAVERGRGFASSESARVRSARFLRESCWRVSGVHAVAGIRAPRGGRGANAVAVHHLNPNAFASPGVKSALVGVAGPTTRTRGHATACWLLRRVLLRFSGGITRRLRGGSRPTRSRHWSSPRHCVRLAAGRHRRHRARGGRGARGANAFGCARAWQRDP